MAESIDFAVIDSFSMIQVVPKNNLIINSFKRGELLAMIHSILFHFLKVVVCFSVINTEASGELCTFCDHLSVNATSL